MNNLKLSRYTILTKDNKNTYLLNTFNANRLIIPEKFHDFLLTIFSDINNAKYQNPVNFLYEQGFLVDSSENELEKVIKKYDQGRHSTKDISLLITPSLRCNMNCFYCYQDRKDTNKLNRFDSQALVEFVDSKIDIGGNINVTWFGGEPLLQMDFIIGLTNRLKKLALLKKGEYRATMVTNGYYLTNEVVKNFKELSISSIQITFDGDSVYHDNTRKSKNKNLLKRDKTFYQIIDNIKHAGDKVNVTIRVNVNQLNKNSINNLIKQLSEQNLQRKINDIYFHPVFNYKVNESKKQYNLDPKINLTMEEYSALEVEWIENAIREGFQVKLRVSSDFHGCAAVKTNSFTVDSNGEIKKCDNEIGEKDTACYSLRDKEFINYEQLHKWDKYRPEKNQYCSQCHFFPTCYSNCPHRNMISEIDRKEKCPSFKFNWQKVFPKILPIH